METRDRAKKMAEEPRGRERGLNLEFRKAPFEGIETEGKGKERKGHCSMPWPKPNAKRPDPSPSSWKLAIEQRRWLKDRGEESDVSN